MNFCFFQGHGLGTFMGMSHGLLLVSKPPPNSFHKDLDPPIRELLIMPHGDLDAIPCPEKSIKTRHHTVHVRLKQVNGLRSPPFFALEVDRRLQQFALVESARLASISVEYRRRFRS